MPKILWPHMFYPSPIVTCSLHRSLPPLPHEQHAARVHRERPYLTALRQCTKPAGLSDACLKALLQ